MPAELPGDDISPIFDHGSKEWLSYFQPKTGSTKKANLRLLYDSKNNILFITRQTRWVPGVRFLRAGLKKKLSDFRQL
jgi:hypothetical protein